MKAAIKKSGYYLAILVMLIYSLSIPAMAKFYDNNFPTDIGVESGYWLNVKTSDTTDRKKAYILIPSNNLDSLILLSNQELFNIGNSVVYGTFVFNGTWYRCRWNSRETMSVYQYNVTTNTWVDVHIIEIYDTNIEFNPVNKNTPLANQNLYLSKYEFIVIMLLSSNLLFTLLGWYMWHKK